MSVVPISGTKELASRTTNIVWRTRSDTFVLIPLLELTRAVAQHHAGLFGNYTYSRNILFPCFRGIFFDCLFIDSFCDLCPTRHHKRGASRDHSQQNSSIALLLSPCLRGALRYRSNACDDGKIRANEYRGKFICTMLSVAEFG